MSLRKGKLVSCQEACAALGKRLLGTTIAHFPGLKFAWVHPEKHVLGQTPDWPEGAFVYVSEGPGMGGQLRRTVACLSELQS